MLFPVDVPMSNSFLLKQGICQWPGCAQRNSSLRFYDMIGFARLIPNSPFGHFLPNSSGIFEAQIWPIIGSFIDCKHWKHLSLMFKEFYCCRALQTPTEVAGSPGLQELQGAFSEKNSFTASGFKPMTCQSTSCCHCRALFMLAGPILFHMAVYSDSQLFWGYFY